MYSYNALSTDKEGIVWQSPVYLVIKKNIIELTQYTIYCIQIYTKYTYVFQYKSHYMKF